jgi:polyisoprenoid-binding protein YceI
LLALALIAATVAAQARSSWNIDPSQTHVRFWVDAIGWPRTAGEFKSFEGRIDIDFDRPSRSRVDFRVVAKSVDVNSATMDDYLRSAGLSQRGEISEHGLRVDKRRKT